MSDTDQVSGSNITESPGDALGARERILNSATRHFLQTGYEGTPTSRIAETADMTAANIYWHFSSKIDILDEVLRTIYSDSYAELEANIREGRATDRLADYVRGFVRMQLTSQDSVSNFGYASLASSLPPERQRELLKAGRPYIDLLRKILEDGIDEGVFAVEDLRVTSWAICSMCEYVFSWFRPWGPVSAEDVGEHYVRLALSMVLKAPAG